MAASGTSAQNDFLSYHLLQPFLAGKLLLTYKSALKCYISFKCSGIVTKPLQNKGFNANHITVTQQFNIPPVAIQGAKQKPLTQV